MKKVAYIAIDVHARQCVLGWMDSDGRYHNEWRVKTSESSLVRTVAAVEAKQKIVTLEEASQALWVARTLRPHVDEVIVCDPRENDLISKNVHKCDGVDTYSLCRLTRLGELKRVYHPEEDHRAIFKEAAREYLKLRAEQQGWKSKIKAKYRRWGIHEIDGYSIYGARRAGYLKQVPERSIRRQLHRLYAMMDAAVGAWDDAWRHLQELGRRYEEIETFQAVPGMGPKGAHLFDAYVQTPHRFANKRKLWRYCGLGIRSRTSAGKPLGYERLDTSGSGELKAISYRAVIAARKTKEYNEVEAFYDESLARTGDPVKARLNTQRKIIAVLYSIWKRRVAYRPELFCKVSPSRRAAA